VPKGVRFVLVAVAALLLSTALSGCFFFSSFKWSKNTVKVGKTTDAIVGMVPATGDQTKNRGYPFILFGFADPATLELGSKRTFDTGGKFGGPKALFNDGALATEAVDSDECQLAGQDLSQIVDVAWKAVRTDVQINDRDKEGVAAKSKVAVKAPHGTPVGQQQVYVVTGSWQDDGDHSPENDEVGCTGGAITTISITG
jgi:hypothetical protein